MITKKEILKAQERLAGRDVLRMADYIEEHGWYQGAMHGPDGNVCILGAAYETHADRSTIRRLNRAFHERFDTGVPAWNDTMATSAVEVISTLREIAFRWVRPRRGKKMGPAVQEKVEEKELVLV